MTIQEKELKAAREKVSWQIQKILAKKPGEYVLLSVLSNRTRGALRPSEWADLLVHLCETGICTAAKSPRNGAMMLALGVHPASHGGPVPTSALANTIVRPALSSPESDAVEQLVAEKTQ
jgi:hypothetical protein